MKIRSLLYWLARLLGDVNAVRKRACRTTHRAPRSGQGGRSCHAQDATLVKTVLAGAFLAQSDVSWRGFR